VAASERPRSYDYGRRTGVRELSWDDFASLCGRLAETLAARGVDSVVGIARSGLLPATVVAAALRCELWPVRVTRRLQDQVVQESPAWKVRPTSEVAGRSVAVIDDVADSGETLSLVAEELRRLGAQRVVTAALVGHSWAAPPPDVCPLATDELVVFPWDRRVLMEGEWRPHPEIEAALAQIRRGGEPGA
jgi:hypoxanthine phosphoribosyltransferase